MTARARMAAIDDRKKARLVGALRLSVGSALLVAPGLAARVSIGPGGDDAGARVFARIVGARDVALGLRSMVPFDSGHEMRTWLMTGAMFDAGDTLAMVIAAGSLTPARRVFMPSVAAGVGLLCYLVGRTID